ncbi:MAG: RHS repeat-associated core domain-containing protein [Akkermansia sp.]|nr:RHS repeat-associated core domain-containing protein [Akkermansia sp.]
MMPHSTTISFQEWLKDHNGDVSQLLFSWDWSLSASQYTRVPAPTYATTVAEVESTSFSAPLATDADEAQVNEQTCTYAYTPFGSVTTSGDITQPIQWSNEYYDNELSLVYYNYRHYNPADGRWINRDPIAEQGGRNLYAFVENLCHSIDFRGLNEIIVSGGCNLNPYGLNVYTIYWYTDMQYYTTHLYNAIGYLFDINYGFHDRN